MAQLVTPPLKKLRIIKQSKPPIIKPIFAEIFAPLRIFSAIVIFDAKLNPMTGQRQREHAQPNNNDIPTPQSHDNNSAIKSRIKTVTGSIVGIIKPIQKFQSL